MLPSDAIANASNTRLLIALNLSDTSRFVNDVFINPANRYLGFNTNLADIEVQPNNIRHPDMSEYIGLSAISHSFDGWNFFSRSIEALLNGDISSCIHFAYYAELRSVMGIMASEGIGIFNQKHMYYDRNQNPQLFHGPTHKIADDLINDWANSRLRKENIFRTIQLNSYNLKDWIIATGRSATGAYAGSLIKDWFSNWSIDLRLKADQGLRNENSYNPHFTLNPVDLSSAIDKLLKIWKGLEPQTANRFPDLDMHLSRLAFEGLFTKATGKAPSEPEYKVWLTDVFNQIGEPIKQQLFEFLLREVAPDDHIIIIEASRDLHNHRLNMTDPLPMICRAFLLLRFSTGAANLLMEDSGVKMENLKFWWEDIATKIGILGSKPSGIDTTDLYVDVQESVNSIEADKASITSVYEANILSYPDLHNLKQFQRVCFWGLGL